MDLDAKRHRNGYLQGFRKIDPDGWEFANEAFLKGQKHLLRNIRRRKAPSQLVSPQQTHGPCVEVGRFGLDAEIVRLRHDKQALRMELVQLRRQLHNARTYLQSMELRLRWTEKKQKRMMNFLARAMQNPEFIHQKDQRKDLEVAFTEKWTRPSDRGLNPIKAEPLDFGDHFGYHVSELEELALEMQGFGKSRRNRDEEQDEIEKELDEGFWEELLNEGFDEERGATTATEGLVS